MTDSITFLRLRPAGEINELWAATRRREGTTTVEVAGLTEQDSTSALAGGLAPVAIEESEVQPMAWVVEPGAVAELVRAGVPGWRTHCGARRSSKESSCVLENQEESSRAGGSSCRLAGHRIAGVGLRG